RWEYRTKDEMWSVLVFEDSVILQTTSYERFEGFADRLHSAVETVLTKTEHDRLGVVQRVGLRYINLIQPEPGRDFRFYLRPGLHGVADDVFRLGTHRLHIESVGATVVDNLQGTMVLRVVQNDQGFDLPPDLVAGAPKHVPRSRGGQLVTLVDLDHFIEGTFDPNSDWIIDCTYLMHDHIIETFHEHVVTNA